MTGAAATSAAVGGAAGRARPDDVRFGFVGAGMVARTALAPAVHAAAGARLQAVAARDPDRAAGLGPAGRVHATYADLVADDEVDVVYVNLTNEAHRPWVEAALAAGRHVLCEKPLGLDAAEVAAMTAAARAADRLLVEALWFRWHPRTRRLVELVASGGLGPVHEVDAEFSFRGDLEGANAGNYRADPARGGGALLDTGCYALSAVHAVLGPRLDVESADVTAGRTGIDLVTQATLRVPDGEQAAGGRAQVRCAVEAEPRQALRVAGAAAVAQLGTGEAFTAWREPTSLTITTPDGGRRVEEFAPVDAYVLMVESVVAAVRGDHDAFLPGLDHSAAVAATSDAIRAAGAA